MPAGFARYLSGARDEAPMHPLTHHEILGLIAPFTRCGRQADLEASNRIERRLVFKPIEHSDVTASQDDAGEVLTLDNPQTGQFTLTRTLTLISGLEAKLQTDGADPAELLARIKSVSPSQQFREVAGVTVALSYRLVPVCAAANGSPPVRLELTRGKAIIANLEIVLNADSVKGYPVQIDLTPTAAGAAELPDDLLAVIGWSWSPLRKTPAGWSGKVGARSREPQRSRDLEVKLDKTVAHLAATLAQPPAFFHDSLRRARWVVTFRRGIPLLIFVGLMGVAAALTKIEIPPGSIINLLIMGAPPLLLFAAFGMRDAPPLEIPPLPGRAKAKSWQLTPEQPAAVPEPPALASVTEAKTQPESTMSSTAAERDAQCPAIP
jgi:hypothetical protein